MNHKICKTESSACTSIMAMFSLGRHAPSSDWFLPARVNIKLQRKHGYYIHIHVRLKKLTHEYPRLYSLFYFIFRKDVA